MTACVGSRGRCHLNSCWMQVLAQTSCRSCCQAESEAVKLSTGRARLLTLTILSQWPLLHWKSVPSPEYSAHSPLVSDKFSVAWPQSRSANWQKHTDTQSPIIARYSHPPLHFSIKAHSWSVHVTQKLSRSSLTGSPSEKLKVEQSWRQVTKCCFSQKRVSTLRWRKVSMLTPKIIWWVNSLLLEPQDRNSFGYSNPIRIRVHAFHWMLEWFHKFLQHVDGNYDNVQFREFLFTKVLYQPAKDQSKIIAWKSWKQSWHIFQGRDCILRIQFWRLRMTHHYGQRKNIKSTHTHQLNFMWLLYFFVKYLNAGHKTCGKRSGKKPTVAKRWLWLWVVIFSDIILCSVTEWNVNYSNLVVGFTIKQCVIHIITLLLIPRVWVRWRRLVRGAGAWRCSGIREQSSHPTLATGAACRDQPVSLEKMLL